MELKELFRLLLLLLLIVCAIAVNCTKSLLKAVVIFMSYSSVMCILWILMESPDLAITEAAVGAGVSGILFLVTLKKVREEDAGDPADEDANADAGTDGSGRAGETDSGSGCSEKNPDSENGGSAEADSAGKERV